MTKALSALLALAIVGQLGVTYALWPELPEQVPIHFDAAGRPDRWGVSSGLEWFLIPAIMGAAGIVAGWLLPALAVRMARSSSPWLNVPDRQRFVELPEASRVRAVQPVRSWLALIGIELQVLTAFLVYGTFLIAVKQWEYLPPVGMYGLLALLLLTAIALAIDSSRAVRRELA